ncbi:MAG TPA: hypothetical protein PLX48_02890 [Candidatus Paceibacterota bacterium]|nr:hypothetical protein [Candidatus Paceibacterota bacterium]
MDLKSIFPLLDFLYAERDDLLYYLLFGDGIENKISPSDFPLIFIGEDSTLIPPVIFQGPQEIHRHCFVSHSFLEHSSLKEKARILDSRLFHSIIGQKTVVINSTMEETSIGENCYINGSTISGSRIKNNVTISSSCSIEDGIIGDGVTFFPQVVADFCRVDEFSSLQSGTKLVSYAGQGREPVVVEKRVYLGPNITVIGPAVIGHNCFVEAGVTIHDDYIPPFSYVRKLSLSNSYQVHPYGAFQLIDGLWYIDRTGSLKVADLIEAKKKCLLLEKEAQKKHINVHERLATIQGERLVVANLLEKNGLKNFLNIVQKEIESLVN